METSNSIRDLKLSDEEIHFSFIKGETIIDTISLDIGINLIIEKFLKLDIPVEAEVEHASNYIEDQLMTNKKFVNSDESLRCCNSLLAEVLNISKHSMVTKPMLEDVFNKYVEYIEGEPEHILGITFTKEKFVTLFLVRDIMYYLKFEAIEICK